MFPKALFLIALSATPAFSGGVLEQSLRPILRPQNLVLASYKSDVKPPISRVETRAASERGLRDWLAGFRKRGRAAGISAKTMDRAFAGVAYDADVVRRDRNQSEFTKTIWDYLDTAVSDARIRNGKSALKAQAKTLAAVEKRYGVPREIVAAIWGLESAFGGYRGTNSTIQSLATLAYDGRRAAFFEDQLIAALTILENGEVSHKNMKGSWAGAMGHTQFMPTSYLDYAVDFNGDKRRDIWSDDPRDALASTAAYLKAHGWKTGVPWGVEVRLPKGFDYASARRDTLKMPSAWAALGVKGTGGAIPDYGLASVLLPAGHRGVAFLIFENFEVLESYNTADAYVIGVGHLSDRLRGAGGFQTDWPREDRVLTFDERIELQTRLTAQGFDTEKIDAKIGPLTVDAVRRFQASKGMVPDGYASLEILKLLR